MGNTHGVHLSGHHASSTATTPVAEPLVPEPVLERIILEMKSDAFGVASTLRVYKENMIGRCVGAGCGDFKRKS